MKFVASRLSDGNKIFPDEITIDDYSATLKSPNFFSGNSKSFPLGQISVAINTPIVGYSDITLYAQGTGMKIHGFTADEARKIKRLIEQGSQKEKQERERQEKDRIKAEDDEWMNQLNRKASQSSERSSRNNYHDEEEQRSSNELSPQELK